MTAADIITLALKDAQIIDESETPSAALMADSLTTLNQFFGMWQALNVYVYATTEITFAPTGAISYTIGPSGADVTVAVTPLRINYAFIEILGVKYPMCGILTDLEEFQSISRTSVSSVPDVIFYNNTYPNGTLYIYPQPSTGTMHLGVDVQLPNYALAPDAFSLDAVYQMPVRFNLAKLLATTVGVKLSPDLRDLAANTLRILQRSNIKIKELAMDNFHGARNRETDFYSGFVR